MIKNLSTFYDLLTNDYSYLKIDSISCFYYMDKERIQSLNDLFKSKGKAEESKSSELSSRHINKLKLKVAFEEDLFELLDTIAQYPVLDIEIKYDGDITEEVTKKCKQFMVKFFNRNFSLENDNQIVYTQLKHFNKKEEEEYYYTSEEDEYE